MKKRLRWMIPLMAAVVLAAALLMYIGGYYRADGTALAALVPDGTVDVSRTDYGWFFDGPSTTDALVFYPGGMVEETAYAPLLRLLAREGMDVCLVSMPLHLAVFGVNRASAVMARYAYDHWYVGGHSLGGAMAAAYAARHGRGLTGLILLAAYPTRTLDASLITISVTGTEDRVLDRAKAEAGKAFVTGELCDYALPGGNHAQYGNYGDQRGDGAAAIGRDEQQRLTVEHIIRSKR